MRFSVLLRVRPPPAAGTLTPNSLQDETMILAKQSRLIGQCNTRGAASTSRRLFPVARAASAQVAEEISTKELTQLLDTLTQPDMTIAELHLEMGDVEIKVRRKVEADAPSAAPAAPAPAPTMASVASVIAPQQMLQPALHLAPMPYQSVDEYGPEESIDESLMYVTANRVGIFRRGKSKCKVGDQVKKGQILGAIEQLGTVVDVKSPQDGEIAAYKVADGDPVEYGGAIVCLAPFFGMEDAGKTQLRGIQ